MPCALEPKNNVGEFRAMRRPCLCFDTFDVEPTNHRKTNMLSIVRLKLTPCVSTTIVAQNTTGCTHPNCPDARRKTSSNTSISQYNGFHAFATNIELRRRRNWDWFKKTPRIYASSESKGANEEAEKEELAGGKSRRHTQAAQRRGLRKRHKQKATAGATSKTREQEAQARCTIKRYQHRRGVWNL